MEAISRIDKCRVQANRLRKMVKLGLEKESVEEDIKAILERFKTSGILKSRSDDESIQLKRLNTFSINKYLELLAKEAGYIDWSTMAQVIKVEDHIDDTEATELYRSGVSEPNLNVWCPTYDDAKAYLDTHKGFYLLQFKGQCFLAQAPHIEGLGLNPQDPDWEKIGRDWVKPKDPEAKSRLREKLQQARKQREGVQNS
ncbi:hypothetical protein [Vibrio rhizosphaerae]|uniref:hypothetical protein n=1 Tax=Vibrio rhizosphaerae TaxID=398736 RepID=UPI000690DE5F|nr:hypothetical protein [Vibrio rhizosphaerae]